MSFTAYNPETQEVFETSLDFASLEAKYSAPTVVRNNDTGTEWDLPEDPDSV